MYCSLLSQVCLHVQQAQHSFSAVSSGKSPQSRSHKSHGRSRGEGSGPTCPTLILPFWGELVHQASGTTVHITRCLQQGPATLPRNARPPDCPLASGQLSLAQLTRYVGHKRRSGQVSHLATFRPCFFSASKASHSVARGTPWALHPQLGKPTAICTAL